MKSALGGIGALIVLAMAGVWGSTDCQVVGADAKGDKMLRHVVLFSFKEEATPAQVEAVVNAFGELPRKIAQISDYEWGTNNSPEGHDKGHTHCFLVTFKSEADRDAYLPHPEHKKFVELLKPILKDVTVVDYWATN